MRWRVTQRNRVNGPKRGKRRGRRGALKRINGGRALPHGGHLAAAVAPRRQPGVPQARAAVTNSRAASTVNLVLMQHSCQGFYLAPYRLFAHSLCGYDVNT